MACWDELREKYAISDEERAAFKAVERKRAFWDLDSEIEAYEENGYAENNGGRALAPTPDEVERIIEDYLDRRHADWVMADECEDMRSAILDVTGIVC